MPTVNIYVIDDHPLMREAVVMLLRRIRPDIRAVELSRFADLELALRAHGSPLLFCLDLRLPDTTGASGILWIRQRYPDTPLVVFSALPASEMQSLCKAAGASAYIEKSTPMHLITETLQRMLPPQPPGSQDAASAPPEDQHAPTALSQRQQQLIAMLDQGLSNREIATQLNISEHTVKVHLWRLFRRLNVKSRTQALHYARHHGFLPF